MTAGDRPWLYDPTGEFGRCPDCGSRKYAEKPCASQGFVDAAKWLDVAIEIAAKANAAAVDAWLPGGTAG